jgi:hypothetical protein
VRLAKLIDGVPTEYSYAKLKADNPLTSFSKPLTKEVLDAFDLVEVAPAEAPQYDPAKYRLVSNGLALTEAGTCYEDFALEPIPLATRRAKSMQERHKLCLKLMAMGALTPSEAVMAANGGWPAAFASAHTGLPAETTATSQIEWASETRVTYGSYALGRLALSLADAQITATQILDQLFEIDPEA